MTWFLLSILDGTCTDNNDRSILSDMKEKEIDNNGKFHECTRGIFSNISIYPIIKLKRNCVWILETFWNNYLRYIGYRCMNLKKSFWNFFLLTVYSSETILNELKLCFNCSNSFCWTWKVLSQSVQLCHNYNLIMKGILPWIFSMGLRCSLARKVHKS